MSTTVLEQPTPTVDTPPFPSLDLFDRCMGRGVTTPEGVKKAPSTCGAQAYIRAVTQIVTDSGEPKDADLVFCKHHGDKLQPVLAAAGFAIIDESEQINVQPSPSGNKD